jgi:type IV pilus assembly protein PilB
MDTRKKIGEILLDAGSVTQPQLEEALKDQVSSNNKLGELMIEKGILTAQQVTEALGLQFMLPVVDVNAYLGNISAINSLPKSLMERLGVFPLELQNNGNTLLVAISDPLNLPVQDELRMATMLNIKFALATEQNIYSALVAITSGMQPAPVLPPLDANDLQTAPPSLPSSPSPLPSLEALGLGGNLGSLSEPPAEAVSSVIPSIEIPQAAGSFPEPLADTFSPSSLSEPPAPQPSPLPPIPPAAAVSNVSAAPFFQAETPTVQAATAPAQAVVTVQTAAPMQAAAPVLAAPIQAAPVQVIATPIVQTAQTAVLSSAPAVLDTPKVAISGNILEMMRSQPKLGDILVQAGIITDMQLAEALKKQKYTGKRLGEILVSEGIITEVKLAEALSTQLKLPMFTLTRYRPMPEAIKSVPRNVSERLQLIPLSIVEGDMLLIAMANPLDLLAQDEVRMLTGRDIKVGITTLTEIQTNLDRLYSLQGNLEEAIVEMYNDTELPQETSESGADDAPVIQLVSNVLDQGVREGASDIHVEPYEKTARIRYRVDGALYTAFDYPVTLHPAVSARMKIMAGMDIAERRKPQDGRILIKVSGRRIDLRVSSLPTLNGEKMVLRILDQESSAVGLERLGLEADDMEKIDIFCGTPWGIMLVTGPTGSGKSTTLYSILEKINQPDVNIITVEDPVEFTVAGINQVHVNEKAGLTFESALRSILRQDPDKVMVGEIRDQKTAQIAIRAALTGHFVLSTLHTNDAPSAATRMVDMGVAPFLVSASLSGVIAQRLVRKLCPFCKEEYEMDPNMCDALEVPHGSHAWKAKGCNECRQGYKGRKGIYEIMMVDDDLRKMILEGVSNITLRSEAIGKGMKTLRRSGINNALAGLTSIEEVFATTL